MADQTEYDVFIAGNNFDIQARAQISDKGKEVAENYLHVVDLIVNGKRELIDEALKGTISQGRTRAFLQTVETIAAWRQTLSQVFGIEKPVYGLVMANLFDPRLAELSEAASQGVEKMPPLRNHEGDKKSAKKQSRQVFELMKLFYAGKLPYQICFLVSRTKGGGQTATVAVAQPDSFANTVDLGDARQLIDITTLEFSPVWQPTEPHLPKNATAITKARMQGIDYDGQNKRSNEEMDKLRAICLTAILKTKLMFLQRIDNPRQSPIIVVVQAVRNSAQPRITHEFADAALQKKRELEQIVLQYQTVADALVDVKTGKAFRQQALDIVSKAEKHLEYPTRILKLLERYVNDGFWGDNRLPVLVCYQDLYPNAPVWFALRVVENDSVSAMTEELERLDNFMRKGEIPEAPPKRTYAEVVSDSG